MEKMINTDSWEANKALTRGVERIYPNREALERVLLSGKKIRLYNGIDPTGKLHIGHLVVLKKLRQFQDLGHEVIVLIGDFTATIGDPTDKSATRKALTRKEVVENTRNYKKQIGRVLDLKKSNVRFLHNGEWSNKLKPTDLLEIFSNFTVARLLERDMFQKRIQEGKDILLHEFVYPAFQAYDSVTMDVDLEVGGNDQTFNMLRGRDLMKKMKNKEKFVMALKLLTDPTGKKMGKTEGNFVALDDDPQDMFGKVMSWPDSLMEIGFELLTSIPLEEAKGLMGDPKNAKIRLAREVTAVCHGKEAADRAEKEFSLVFQKGGMPSRMREAVIEEKTISIIDLLVKTKMASSKSEAKRLIEQRGVSIDEKTKSGWREEVEIKKGMVIRVGKRNFLKIT